MRVTWPATDAALDKWRQGETVVVRESAAAYSLATLQFVRSLPAAQTEWVNNILEGRKEVERVWLANEDMVLVPDFKMNLADTSTLYLQALFRDVSLLSIRDLRAAHLPLLRRVRDAVLGSCTERGFPANQLRLFFHYFPSFWRLHLHVAHIRCVVPGGGLNAGRAVLLEDVIQNLELVPDYYEKATLVSTLKVGTPHHKFFQEAGF